MTIETELDLEKLKKIGRIVADCLQLMGRQLEAGMTSKELDDIGDQYLTKHDARSAPRLCYSFPGSTCISVNHQVAHGIPGTHRFRAGDIVNIDVSAELDGYFADTGGSFLIPPESKKKKRVCEGTQLALQSAIRVARAGQPLNGIGREIERIAKKTGLSVIRNLGSHGVGRALHEDPEFIPAFYDKRDRRVLKEGMVITIEPFLSTGATSVDEADDGWTLYTDAQFVSAQYEHTIVITKGEALIMTLPSA